MKHQDSNAIQERLLAWFKQSCRNMPWRETRDPYAIWISEVMLQQTQVVTVRPYFKRFMRQFPDVRALAEASPQTVLKAWEGLGYYSRARNLHHAARTLVSDFNGKLPSDVKALLSLPGIGRYTAGAIASIAFGLDEPVLDGNVTRVLCRLFRIRENPGTTRIEHKLWSLARRLIPSGQAAVFNQAMMDLGATVCIPRRPQCPVCPLDQLCQARSRNEQDHLPIRPQRKPLPHHDIAAGVIRKGARILIAQRKPEGLLGGLWEFPGGKREDNESLETCLARELREELNIKVGVGSPIMTVKHAYSHFRITLHVFECRYISGRPKTLGCAAFAWVTVAELDRYAFPKANHSILDVLRRQT